MYKQVIDTEMQISMDFLKNNPDEMEKFLKSAEKDDFWAEGSFAETMNDQDWELKKRTFSMKHDEEMDYDCKQCNVKISAHNKDWHDGLCDKCFDKNLK